MSCTLSKSPWFAVLLRTIVILPDGGALPEVYERVFVRKLPMGMFPLVSVRVARTVEPACKVSV